MALRFKRGTRAQLNAAATAGQLVQGQPYLVTDDGTMALGTSTTTYVDLAPITGAKRIAVVTSLPGSPDANTLYFTTT